MKRTQLMSKTRRDAPADEAAKNAQLLIKAGYIHKEMAGVYAYLPLGLKVVENIKQIVREEMDAIGSQELIMTSLQSQELWETTDRWDDEKVDVWFKSQLKNGTDVGFGWSHEEPITNMMKNHVSSYRDLPAYVYQFQTKMRNETRAKSGIMRCREFVMKDLYSYSLTEEDHQKFYDKVTQAYLNVFERVGLGASTYFTFASGGAFTQFSHEFQTICDAGEDIIYVDEARKIAINKEVLTEEVIEQLGLRRDDLVEKKAAEVGNIFSFGGAKSEQLGLYFSDKDGSQKPVILGSYGIGITRLMGVIVEAFSDEKGIVWPEAVAPAKVYLASLGNDEEVVRRTNELYEELQNAGVSVIFDDREANPGEKLADADLIGLPYRIVVSKKTIEANTFEFKARNSEEVSMLGREELLAKLVG
jgi:prolyl-tRNA synthetase